MTETKIKYNLNDIYIYIYIYIYRERERERELYKYKQYIHRKYNRRYLSRKIHLKGGKMYVKCHLDISVNIKISIFLLLS